MNVRRRFRLLVVACVLALGAPALAPASAAAPVQPLLTGIRAAHHPGFDRVVFDFYGRVPSSPRVEFVRAVIAPSGRAVPIAGQAILQVTFRDSRGHKDDGTATAPSRVAFPLPNVLTAVQGEDFEAVLTYGIGLSQRAAYRVSTLSNPPRVVVDIDTDFSWVNRPVWFFDETAFVHNDEPFFRPVSRPIISSAPAHGLVDRIFAGPTDSERAQGLRFLSSRATFYSDLSVSSGEVARLRLRGGCSSGGSTVNISGQVFPTLKQLPNVSWVKIYDYYRNTERPTGRVDSIPECLEP
jgi:hypothetical protein